MDCILKCSRLIVAYESSFAGRMGPTRRGFFWRPGRTFFHRQTSTGLPPGIRRFADGVARARGCRPKPQAGLCYVRSAPMKADAAGIFNAPRMIENSLRSVLGRASRHDFGKTGARAGCCGSISRIVPCCHLRIYFAILIEAAARSAGDSGGSGRMSVWGTSRRWKMYRWLAPIWTKRTRDSTVGGTFRPVSEVLPGTVELLVCL